MAGIIRYCTLADVEALTGYALLAESQPSIPEALAIVTSLSAEIDGILSSAGYALPVPPSASRSLAMLKAKVSMGAACLIWEAMFKGQTQPPGVTRWCAEFTKFKQDLIDDNIRLADFPPVAGRNDAFITII